MREAPGPSCSITPRTSHVPAGPAARVISRQRDVWRGGATLFGGIEQEASTQPNMLIRLLWHHSHNLAPYQQAKSDQQDASGNDDGQEITFSIHGTITALVC